MTAVSASARRWSLPDRSVWLTPEMIYGTIFACAVLTAAEDDVTDGELLATVAATSVVLWGAHTFAVVMARHGRRDGHETTLGQAASHAATHSAGLLLGPALSIVVLALGAANLVPDQIAITIAQLLGIAVIMTVGVLACVERGKRWWVCALAGLATGAVGAVIIVLSALFE